MESLILVGQGAIIQGLFWGVMVLGVYITYKILQISDLTVDGSFALGGSICAVMVTSGVNPFLALLASFAAGLLAGFITGFLHTKFEIPAILAGILTQISLWSINLRIMGRSNIPLLKSETIFTSLSAMLPLNENEIKLIFGILLIVILIAVLYWFFGTELGSAIRATGNNENMIRALGVNTKRMKLLALMISNGFVALSGALVCQSQKVGDIQMGTGAIVIALASIIIGGVLLGRLKSFGGKLAGAVSGSMIYFIIRAIVLQLGMDSNDMKLISAIMVALALSVPYVLEKRKQKKMAAA